MIELSVPLGDRSYPVLVGHGARHRLLELLPVGVKRVAIVTQESIPVTVDPGSTTGCSPWARASTARTSGTIEDLCRDWAQWGLNRGDCVVAVGGGVVTDTAGFAAAVYHRGIPVVHVSTTLLGQVDAAIGGKTGVNLPEGKNLVGAFWQPSAVLCDTEVLATLPPREYRNGLGEMAKYAFLGVDDLPDLALEDAVAACVRCKADVVGSDERESGRRAILNYGHTLGPRPGDGRPRRPPPRRGRGHRPHLRRRAGPAPRPDRRGPGRGAPQGRRWLRPADEGAAGPRP